jgi:hypothetical protein
MEITLTEGLLPAVRELSMSKHPLINFHFLEDPLKIDKKWD